MTGSAAKSESPTDAAALLPPRLSIGDRVRLILPASFPTAEWVEETRHILEDWGLVVDVGRHAMDQWGFMAGRDQDRLDDLNEAFRDRGVRAVMCHCRWCRAYRIAPAGMPHRIAEGIDGPLIAPAAVRSQRSTR